MNLTKGKFMDISLSPNIERFLRIKVAEGLYDSLNEAINATLSIALTKECISQKELDMLNADIQKGIDDANAGNVSDAFDFLDELKAKYE
jgi:putative addiction module CopG family antidote